MSKKAQSTMVLGAVSCVLTLAACHSYKDSAVEVVRQNRSDITACISEAGQRNATLKGSMEMKIQVAPNGKVNQFAFTKDDVKDPQFTECVKNRAIQWQLPPTPSGKPETFDYKFNVGLK